MSAQTTRERILQQGLSLISRDGLGGVSLGALALEVGMSKSGLFAHFGSKEEVQIELMRHMARVTARCVLEPAMAEPEGLPRLRAFVEHWLNWTERAGLSGGCPIAAALFEVDDVAGPVREQVVLMEGEGRALLGRLVAQAIERGHLRSGVDIEQFVWELCGIYLSHHVSTRFLRAPDADARARTAFEALISRARPEPLPARASE